MEESASIFCHIPDGLTEHESHQELWRQHDLLTQEAVRIGRTIEHCFFHVGKFDLEKPDKVLLHFLQRAQAKDLGLVLIENMEWFPLSQQARMPQMEVCFVKENCQKTIGSDEIQIEMGDDLPQNGYVYLGF